MQNGLCCKLLNLSLNNNTSKKGWEFWLQFHSIVQLLIMTLWDHNGMNWISRKDMIFFSFRFIVLLGNILCYTLIYSSYPWEDSPPIINTSPCLMLPQNHTPPLMWQQRMSGLAYPTPFVRSISQASKQKEYGVWDLWFSIVVNKTCSGLQERGLVQLKNSSIQCKLRLS